MRALVAAAVLVVAPACVVHDGPAPLYSANVDSAENPLPDERMVDGLRTDWAFPFLPNPAWTLESEVTFASWGDALAEGRWGVNAPVFVRFAAPLEGTPAPGAALFVRLDGDMAPAPAVTTWIADPGYLVARPPAPLPRNARLALVLLRSLLPGQSLARSDDFEAHAQGAGRADLEKAAVIAGVSPDEVALLVPYRSADPSAEMAAARALALAAGPPPLSLGPARPLEELSGDVAEQAWRLPPTARVAEGSFSSLDLHAAAAAGQDAEEVLWDPAKLSGLLAPERISIQLVMVLPDAARFPPPWPTVIAMHGFNDNRSFGAKVGRAFVEQGRAVLAMDAASHGERGSASGLIRIDEPRILRDHMRQSALDLVQLLSAIQAGTIDVDGVPGPDLDGTASYFGHSMGTIIGGVLLGVDDRIDAAVLNAPGASYQDIFQEGRLKGSISFLMKPALGLDVDDPAYESALPFCAGAVQSILDLADPLAYAPLHQAHAPPTLLQVNLDDGLLPNRASFALGASLGARELSAALEDGEPQDALWRLDSAAFGYPEDDDPHALHTFTGAPGIHDQAARYLASGGRVVLDPLPLP